MLIAGPCSVESFDQVDELANSLSGLKIDYLRGGIWKPRTRPGSYEGVGEIGLEWLQEIKVKYQIRVITEVATAAQVDMVLKAGFDAVWIGARTTVNPFYVQEIADALKGVDIPIFVKNPINPDLSLWIGAIERIKSSILGEVSAIHRGFSSFKKYKFRNQPQWTIPISLKEEFPSLKILCDPSHIAGDRQVVPEIAQHALDLQFDGLMIETHPDPSQAKSDAAQQLTPLALRQLMDSLIIRKKESMSGFTSFKMSELRNKIDELDENLIHLLAERMKFSNEIGDMKSEESISILQPERWKWIIKTARKNGDQLNLSEEFVNALFNVIHEESINRQVIAMKNQKSN
jgi:chorismate mutase